MKNKVNKKGQDLSIGTLILIVLGIVVLVLLVLGFSMGWENLWEKINIFGGGSSIGTVASACELAAQQDNKYGYCQEFKRVKVGQTNEYVNCQDTRLQSSIDTRLNCDLNEVNNAIQMLCDGFTSDSDRINIRINGNTCKERFDTIYDATGKRIPTDPAAEQQLTAYTTECMSKQGTVDDTITGNCPAGKTLVQVDATRPQGKVCCRA